MKMLRRVVFDAADQWVIGVQHAPDHVAPEWPDGNARQVHLDLHITDPVTAHDEAIALGARLLQADDLNATSGNQVYADPAGHPFCLGWGQPDDDAVRRFLHGHGDRASS